MRFESANSIKATIVLVSDGLRFEEADDYIYVSPTVYSLRAAQVGLVQMCCEYLGGAVLTEIDSLPSLNRPLDLNLDLERLRLLTVMLKSSGVTLMCGNIKHICEVFSKAVKEYFTKSKRYGVWWASLTDAEKNRAVDLCCADTMLMGCINRFNQDLYKAITHNTTEPLSFYKVPAMYIAEIIHKDKTLYDKFIKVKNISITVAFNNLKATRLEKNACRLGYERVSVQVPNAIKSALISIKDMLSPFKITEGAEYTELSCKCTESNFIKLTQVLGCIGCNQVEYKYNIGGICIDGEKDLLYYVLCKASKTEGFERWLEANSKEALRGNLTTTCAILCLFLDISIDTTYYLYSTREYKGKRVGWCLKNANGDLAVVDSKALKAMLNSGRINVINLAISANNKLLIHGAVKREKIGEVPILK